MEKIYFEDYSMDETFVSPARTVTEADIHSYASLPCKIGDTIHTEVKVVGMAEKDEERGILTCEYKIANQKSETVLVFTTRTLVGRRPAA